MAIEQQSIDRADWIHYGIHQFTGASFSFPNGSVNDASIANGAGIQAQKLIHTEHCKLTQEGGTDVVDADKMDYVARYTGLVNSVKLAVEVAPAGGDLTVTVDVLKSTGGGAFASILTAPEVVDSSNTDLVFVNVAISDTSIVAGDILKTTATVGGSTGTQAQGLVVDTVIFESAQ